MLANMNIVAINILKLPKPNNGKSGVLPKLKDNGHQKDGQGRQRLQDSNGRMVRKIIYDQRNIEKEKVNRANRYGSAHPIERIKLKFKL